LLQRFAARERLVEMFLRQREDRHRLTCDDGRVA
jgi:hypothetical protein